MNEWQVSASGFRLAYVRYVGGHERLDQMPIFRGLKRLEHFLPFVTGRAFEPCGVLFDVSCVDFEVLPIKRIAVIASIAGVGTRPGLTVPRFELPDLCVSRKVCLDLTDQLWIVGEI